MEKEAGVISSEEEGLSRTRTAAGLQGEEESRYAHAVSSRKPPPVGNPEPKDIIYVSDGSDDEVSIIPALTVANTMTGGKQQGSEVEDDIVVVSPGAGGADLDDSSQSRADSGASTPTGKRKRRRKRTKKNEPSGLAVAVQ